MAPPNSSDPVLPAVNDALATTFDAVSLMCIESTATPSALLATCHYKAHNISHASTINGNDLQSHEIKAANFVSN